MVLTTSMPEMPKRPIGGMSDPGAIPIVLGGPVDNWGSRTKKYRLVDPLIGGRISLPLVAVRSH